MNGRRIEKSTSFLTHIGNIMKFSRKYVVFVAEHLLNQFFSSLRPPFLSVLLRNSHFVLDPPHSVNLTPASRSYTLAEGEDSLPDVRCEASCNPACDIRWEHNGAVLTTLSSVLKLLPIDRSLIISS